MSTSGVGVDDEGATNVATSNSSSTTRMQHPQHQENKDETQRRSCSSSSTIISRQPITSGVALTEDEEQGIPPPKFTHSTASMISSTVSSMGGTTTSCGGGDDDDDDDDAPNSTNTSTTTVIITGKLKDGSGLRIRSINKHELLRWALQKQSTQQSTTTTTTRMPNDEVLIQSFRKPTASKDSSSTRELSPPTTTTTVPDVVHQWASEATIHGIPFTLNLNFKAWRKILWACISLLAFFVLFRQIQDLLIDYRKYEVNSNVEIASPTTLPFPEVTICNVDSFQWRKMFQNNVTEPRNETELLAISQSRSNFILAATYDNEDVTDSWKPVITHNGLCWQFNTDKRITLPGDSSSEGLWVSLYVNTPGYSKNNGGGGDDNVVTVAGTHVFVAPPNTTTTSQMPIGLVPPGTATFMALERTVVQRETQKPWSRCKGIATTRTTTTASPCTQQMCRANCVYKVRRQEYGCRDMGDPIPDVDFCFSTTINDDDALQAAGGNNITTVSSFDEKVRECVSESCSVPTCYEEIYSMTVSSLALESPSLDEYIVLRINYASMKETRVTETRATTPSELYGSIGGLMGLYLGISALSVIEVVGELFLLRLLPRLFGNRSMYGLGSKDN